MGRLAFAPGRADGAVAFIQVACSIYQGYTSRSPGYIIKATMLLVSESGVSRKEIRQMGKNFILDVWSKGDGDHFDYTHAQKHFSWIQERIGFWILDSRENWIFFTSFEKV
jgi:hypothetical protein